ncbi:hypothetical protein P9112_004813 [Eukaryota sp. TZLM1-RC]
MSTVIPLNKSHFLHIFRFSNVTNTLEVRDAVFNKTLDFTLIRTDMVLDVFQLICAAEAVVMNQNSKLFRNRPSGTELLFSFGPSKNMTETIRHFGVDSASTTDVLLAKISQSDEQLSQKDVKIVKGELVGLNDLEENCNVKELMQAFEISNEMLEKNQNLLNLIVTKMSLKTLN